MSGNNSQSDDNASDTDDKSALAAVKDGKAGGGSGADEGASELGKSTGENAAGEGKKTDDGGAEMDTGKSEPLKPEDYEFDFPEGVKVDEGFLKEYREVAAKEGLSKETAAKVASLYAERTKALADAQKAEHDEWQKELKAEGLLSTEKLKIAARARDWADDPALTKLVNGPLGNYPPLLRLLHKVGTFLKEDSFEGGGGGGRSGDREIKDIMYPDMKK